MERESIRHLGLCRQANRMSPPGLCSRVQTELSRDQIVAANRLYSLLAWNSNTRQRQLDNASRVSVFKFRLPTVVATVRFVFNHATTIASLKNVHPVPKGRPYQSPGQSHAQ
jgi:hypothetical protein